MALCVLRPLPHTPLMTSNVLPHSQSDELSGLLAGASAAAPETRIKFRDPLAAQGDAVIGPMKSWIADPRLGAFAVRVLEAVSKPGQLAGSPAALRASRRLAGSDAIRRDIEAALQRLRTAATR
jgi:hypothetical protein